jgi:hypothetical protein
LLQNLHRAVHISSSRTVNHGKQLLQAPASILAHLNATALLPGILLISPATEVVHHKVHCYPCFGPPSLYWLLPAVLQVVPSFMSVVRRHKLLRRLLTVLQQQLRQQQGAAAAIPLATVERQMSQPQHCPLALYALVSLLLAVLLFCLGGPCLRIADAQCTAAAAAAAAAA